jgi:hypothetical protein
LAGDRHALHRTTRFWSGGQQDMIRSCELLNEMSKEIVCG